MASPPDPQDLQGLAAIGAAAGTALAWFLYFLKKTAGRPATDPTTQILLNGIKDDIERVEHAFENHATETNKRVRDLELAMVRVKK